MPEHSARGWETGLPDFISFFETKENQRWTPSPYRTQSWGADAPFGFS